MFYIMIYRYLYIKRLAQTSAQFSTIPGFYISALYNTFQFYFVPRSKNTSKIKMFLKIPTKDHLDLHIVLNFLPNHTLKLQLKTKQHILLPHWFSFNECNRLTRWHPRPWVYYLVHHLK